MSDASTSQLPVVVVYRTVLMNYNEGYVRTEAEALRRYRPVYVGAQRATGGVELPADRTITLRERYRSIDRCLDPLVTRVGRGLQRVPPGRAIGRALARGELAGRLSQYAFLVQGISPMLRRELGALRPALIHAYTGLSGAHVLPLARRLGIPLVVSFGGTDATAADDAFRGGDPHGYMLPRRRGELQHHVRWAITVSEFLRSCLLDRGWPADRVVVLHRGVDTTLFTPEGAPPLAERAPIVFHAGRLIEVKGTTYLLQAMQAVQRRVPTAELVLAGEGRRRPLLEREAAELGVRVRFVGSISSAEVRGWHARARVYCMPSVTASTGQREGLSNALLEAMASGLPVVGSRSGGIPEAIGDAGVLVAERDVAALAARIGDILVDDGLACRLGSAARERVLRHFALRKQVAALERLYDDVVRGSPPRVSGGRNAVAGRAARADAPESFARA